jgi:hypothetical protein
MIKQQKGFCNFIKGSLLYRGFDVAKWIKMFTNVHDNRRIKQIIDIKMKKFQINSFRFDLYKLHLDNKKNTYPCYTL